VKVDTGSERYSQRIEDLFQDLTGKKLDPDAVARRVTTLYGEGSLDVLDYHVVRDDSHYGIALDARGASTGPNYVRFGLNLQDDFQGNSTYNAAMRFVMSEITRPGGEWVVNLQVGQQSLAETEVFLPLEKFSGWFVMPHVMAESHDVTLPSYPTSQDQFAQYRVHTFEYGLDFGRQFGNWGEIRAGALRDQGHSRLTIGDPIDPNTSVFIREATQPFGTRKYFLRFSYDSVDDVNFPHSGHQAMLQWTGARNVVGAEQASDQVTFNYLGAHSFGRDTVAFSASGGTTLNSGVTDVRMLFPLGGFLNLSGLRANSLYGPNFGIARLLAYRQIGRGGPGYLDVPTYLGMSLEAGNVWNKRPDVDFIHDAHHDASIFLGMDTILGPVYIATGFDDRGQQQFYLFLGRTF
jgi:NTE family protein